MIALSVSVSQLIGAVVIKQHAYNRTGMCAVCVLCVKTHKLTRFRLDELFA